MYSVVSLFSGCGGLDLGFQGGFSFHQSTYSRHPFNILLANDFNERACLTYQHNLGSHVVCQDVASFLDAMPLTEVDVLIGGFPCQAFSHAGKREGFADKKGRGQLYLEMIRATKMLRPKIFVAENVAGLLDHDGGKTIKTIRRKMQAAGYRLYSKLCLVSEYGVPQRRTRIIMVGVRKDLKKDFQFTSPSVPPLSSKSALSSLEAVPEGGMANHFWSKAKKNKGQGNTTLDPDKPAPTIRAEHHGNIEFHYALPRRISAREAARLQSFPDSFEFLKTTGDAYRQIGNAVPPVLGWYIAQDVATFLTSVTSQCIMNFSSFE